MQIEPDITGMLQHLLDRARKLLHADSVLVVNRDGEVLAVSGELHGLKPTAKATGTELADSIYEKGTVYLQNENQYREFISPKGKKKDQPSAERDFWSREKIQSSVFIRLGEEADPVGVMSVNYRTPQIFDSSRMELVEAFASIAGVAILNHQHTVENSEFWEQQHRDSFSLSLNEIISSIAHNSGNLLFSLNMRFIRFADRVRKSKANQIDKQSVEDFLNDIQEPLTELTEDFKRLKDYRNLDKLVVQSCKVEDLIDGSLLLLRNIFDKHRITVKKRYSLTPELSCEKSAIQHVLLNLILNAVDAIDRNGIITIQTDVKDGYVRIRITDNGIGIPTELRSQIFQPFFTTKKSAAGAGVGLSLSRYIVRKHGGKIEFTTTVKKGTTFYVYLPIP